MKRVIAALILAAASVSIGAPVAAAPDAALQARARAGDAEAEFQMGEIFRGGKGANADLDAAIMWYRRAAAQGHIRASEELGFALFAHGDRREAMPYIEKAAARGEARAFYLLGTAHFNGDYATRDWPLAYAQTERAASAGLTAAQKNLELMNHYLLPADKAKADQILATLPAIRTTPPEGTATPPAKASAPVQPGALPPKTAKISKPVATAVNAAAARAGGAWKVQLGAFGSEDRARARWKTLRAKVADLGSYQQHIVYIDQINGI